ncbi:thermonuclease family protein [Loktanella fryxellensis]|uniref:thermonuclease family protein n=1 Tax=Loktanella fryxellensis TaxID=245187 RepID=UPI001FE1A257|nr:thermonuclease family protein [Loktanella fryxellensis]
MTIRMHGIDAPESAQLCLTPHGDTLACGDVASAALRAMTDGHDLACTAVDVDRYGRTVAQCRTVDGDLGRRMVAAGYALAYRRYSTAYVGEEDRARASRAGLWATEMQDPAAVRAAGAATDATPGSCAIKGNISGNGRIYHSPGQAFYDDTQIDVDRGERWFCSPQEAVAAGWRPARR